jgi:hypothetical protein
MDTNVDPSSTFQVVNALIKANKKHDLLFVPGANHGAGGPHTTRLLYDFFVHHLLGVEPPDWNKLPNKTEPAAVTTGSSRLGQAGFEPFFASVGQVLQRVTAEPRSSQSFANVF